MNIIVLRKNALLRVQERKQLLLLKKGPLIIRAHISELDDVRKFIESFKRRGHCIAFDGNWLFVDKINFFLERANAHIVMCLLVRYLSLLLVSQKCMSLPVMGNHSDLKLRDVSKI